MIYKGVVAPQDVVAVFSWGSNTSISTTTSHVGAKEFSLMMMMMLEELSYAHKDIIVVDIMRGLLVSS
jgi:hypothetical protein